MKPNGLRRRIALWIVVGTGVFVINPGRVQAQSYQYHPYWGLNGWVAQSYLPPTMLQITPLGESVRVEWPLSLSNALLQTAMELPAVSGWQTVTIPADIDVVPGSCSVTLPATNEQQFFRLCGTEMTIIPVFSFAAFVDAQMELTRTAPLTFRGRVQANGPICLGPPSPSSLSFMSTVSTGSSIVYSNLGGYATANMTGPVIYHGTPPYLTNTPPLKLSGVVTNARAILEIPPGDEPVGSSLGLHRFYNKAAVVLLISNTTVTVTVKDQGTQAGIADSINYNSITPTNLVELTNLVGTLPFLMLTNTFTDYRESKRVKAADINVGVLKEWLVTNSMVLSRYHPVFGPYPNIMYVGDFRSGTTNLFAVRVLNGSLIPTNGPSHAQATGFTLATPNPIYVWGHYNTPNVAHRGSTNTTAVFPASLVGDAITILSLNWADSTYGTTTLLFSRVGADTTVNAAIIAGAVYSTGSASGEWSGGLHNLPRLLEYWAGRTLTINGSFVNLCASAKATNQFQLPGVYYNAPNRNFNFNQNFNDPAKLPPGTPTVIGTTPLD